MLVDTMTEPGPMIVGLEDAESSFAIPDSVRNAADAKVSPLAARILAPTSNK